MAARPELPSHDPACPFCAGNEGQTPPEVLRRPEEGDWRVRVVPNLYAALAGDRSVRPIGPPLFREMPGAGAHEVVIETPRHDARLEELDPDHVASVVGVWRERYRALIAEPHVRAVVVFRNFGPLAGTSLVHPHSQIVATPVDLPRLLRRMDVATRYHDENGTCVYDDVIRAEREAGTRIVTEAGRFVSFCPWAASSPYETWIAPTFHQGSFGDLADAELQDLATTIVRTLDAVRRATGDPDHNLVLFSSPTDDGHAERVFHWHLKLIAKLSTPAGFELGSAMSINVVAPEEAAERLRAELER
jgi:UDPglucose--hexose-1-phosphate uridylyltransferase